MTETRRYTVAPAGMVRRARAAMMMLMLVVVDDDVVASFFSASTIGLFYFPRRWRKHERGRAMVTRTTNEVGLLRTCWLLLAKQQDSPRAQREFLNWMERSVGRLRVLHFQKRRNGKLRSICACCRERNNRESRGARGG
jgi:hypothetical protein